MDKRKMRIEFFARGVDIVLHGFEASLSFGPDAALQSPASEQKHSGIALTSPSGHHRVRIFVVF